MYPSKKPKRQIQNEYIRRIKEHFYQKLLENFENLAQNPKNKIDIDYFEHANALDHYKQYFEKVVKKSFLFKQLNERNIIQKAHFVRFALESILLMGIPLFRQFYSCDLCNAATHQSCYGSEIFNELPEKQKRWYCQRCKALLKYGLKQDSIKCFFCPELKGIIKQYQGSFFAHPNCVNLIPYLDFKNNIEEKEKFSGHEDMDFEIFNQTCQICKIKYGACCQCDAPNQQCSYKFHATCGQNQGIIPRYRPDISYDKLYCFPHMKKYQPGLKLFSNQYFFIFLSRFIQNLNGISYLILKAYKIAILYIILCKL